MENHCCSCKRISLKRSWCCRHVALDDGMATAEVRAAIIAAVLPRGAAAGGEVAVVLREQETGCVVPICADLPLLAKSAESSVDRLPLVLELVAEQPVGHLETGPGPETAAAAAPAAAAAASAGGLEWMQEPPHSACEWLTMKAANCASMPHCFSPAPAVLLPGWLTPQRLQAAGGESRNARFAAFPCGSTLCKYGRPFRQGVTRTAC